MKNFLHRFIHIWDTYDSVSDIFVKPTTHFYFGSWRNFHGLPVWRRGIILRFGKYNQYSLDEGDWLASWSSHTYWNPEFLHTCSRWGRFWRRFIKPTYQLPIWLSFYHSNYDIIWKTKWNSCRYEFPSQFCIVAFGICFAMWTEAPHASTDKGIYSDNDAYWETILEWIVFKRNNPYKTFKDFLSTESSLYGSVMYNETEKKKRQKLIIERSQYIYNTEEYKNISNKLDKIKGVKYRYLSCRPEYIKEEYKEQYNNAVTDIKNNKKFKDCYFIYD